MQAPRPAAVLTFALVAASVVAASCWGGGSGDRTPGPSPVPTARAGESPIPTAAPTLPPPSLSAAERLSADGDFEGAIQITGEIAAGGIGDAQRARLAQAQLLSRTGRYQEAQATLDVYLAAEGPAADASDARYLLASTLDDLGDMAGAADNYARYIDAGGRLAEYARIERAKLLARLSQPAAALQAAEVVVAGPLGDDIKASFMLSMGRASEQGHDDIGALMWYGRATTAPGGDVASALARAGAIKKRQSDPAWVDDYVRSISGYPGSGSAPDLLDELDAAAVPVSDFTRGLVDYRAFRNDVAMEALERAVAAGDNTAQAAYYLGALAERAGDDAGAIGHYEQSYQLDPASPVADDALWWRARLLESAGRLGEAAEVYATLESSFPASGRAADASFRRGLVSYKDEDYTQAAQVWSSIADAGGDEAVRARFWQGRALQKAGDSQGKDILRQLVADPEADGSFYALRAEVLLGDNDKKKRDADLEDQPTDWSNIERYLRGATGPDFVLATVDDARWKVAASLESVGLRAQSAAAFNAMLRDASPGTLYAILRRADAEGRTSLAARAAVSLNSSIASLPQTSPPREAPPQDLLRQAYPPAYSALVEAAAEQEKLDPLLLLSLMRQESFYDPDAGSGAGALGLTQVVPSTGESIAAGLGITDFAADDLYRPRVSVQFGADYLASQLDAFDDDAYLALAAYNGGPGASSRALKTSGDDIDLFVEELEFDETQLYVRLVMENLARYRELYEGTDRPTLPR